jgi:hypothetical protein
MLSAGAVGLCDTNVCKAVLSTALDVDAQQLAYSLTCFMLS